MTNLTTEQKLQAIIQRQVEGGCDKFLPVTFDHWELSIPHDAATLYLERKELGFAMKVDERDYFEDYVSLSILEILLDTEGLKAIWNEQDWSDRCTAKVNAKTGEWEVMSVTPAWECISRKILDAWNSGNDWKAAIDVAFTLLDQ